ncbi:MAG TPA: asparaginase [Noviherbaspirillum sp.]|nr:asparaginase [Noviherbaspirillum sp.]
MITIPHAALAEVTRGGQLESIHYGSVAVVDARGKLLYAAGDPDFMTFTRSSIKPFQALPFLLDGGPAQFGFGPREIALQCASHSGEDMHVQVVEGMLKKAGCDEHHLQCGCHLPMRYAQGEAPPAGMKFNQLHNNCSGKHAGFLAWCVQHHEALDTYLDPAHPLQQAIRTALARVAGVMPGELVAGTDGCSAPNYALPLSRLAYTYARLAQGREDAEFGPEMGTLFDAMTTHPELVSGTGRSDQAFMRTAPGDWVAKVGAEAVQVIGIRSAGIGLAVKIADGNNRALYPAVIAALQQLGLLSHLEDTPLAAFARPPIRNARGLDVGEIRPLLELNRI